MRYTFASDNTSGICPEAWQALQECNAGYLASYGNDAITSRATELFREVFETDCEVFFVFNGTAANSLALASLCQSYHSVICHEVAHIETDECGAPEFFSNGTKLLLAPGNNGKVDPLCVESLATKRSDIHYPRPNVLSLSLPSEVGTVYSLDELLALRDVAVRHNLKIHMDGSRFANAVASRGESPAALTWRSGIDVLCCGGTKLGIGRKLAPQCRPCQWLRAAALGESPGPAGRSRALSRAGECRLSRTSPGGSRPPKSERLGLLRFHRRRRTVHVLVGHDSRRSGGTRRRHRGGGLTDGFLPASREERDGFLEGHLQYLSPGN